MEEKILKMVEQISKKLDNWEEKINKIDGIEQKLDTMKIQQDENTQILRALKDSAEVNKAEHDKMMMDIAKIQGDVQSIKKKIDELEVVTGINCKDITYLKAAK